MKYLIDFEKCGIHTRLRNVIKKSDGYNRLDATYSLMKEYNIYDFEVAYEMAKNESIREEIKAIGLDNILKLTRKSINIRKIKFRVLANIF